MSLLPGPATMLRYIRRYVITEYVIMGFYCILFLCVMIINALNVTCILLLMKACIETFEMV